MNAISEWFRKRRDVRDQRALDGLRSEGESSVPELSRRIGVGAGTLYVSLARLEARGEVTSRWVDHPNDRPRRRFYSAVKSGDDARHEPQSAEAWAELRQHISGPGD